MAMATLVCVALTARAKIMRNNALMNRMMSQFQKDNSINLSVEPTANPPQQSDVMSLMQGVLCRNFPTIPCAVIMQDDTLSRLIKKSIQEINNKKRSLERTTQAVDYKTKYPIVNSEDLSNFLQVQNTGYFEDRGEKYGKKKQKTAKTDRVGWSHESLMSTKKQNSKRTSMYGRKKLRKFYPHKVKYKDKNLREAKPEFRDYSDEKLSMSVELPDMMMTKQHQHFSYKLEPADPAVWRIDYAKHGEPSMNLLGSLTKSGAKAFMDDNELEPSPRKDVLHPDVYIKKNYVRRNSELID
ncbi:unnamed protein product, partial [Iphiclides podalirius]